MRGEAKNKLIAPSLVQAWFPGWTRNYIGDDEEGWPFLLDEDDGEEEEEENGEGCVDKKLRRVDGSQGFLHEESLCQQLRGFFGPCTVELSMINKVKPCINPSTGFS